MKKFSVDPREFLESDTLVPSKIVSRISNITGTLLNDEWETSIANVYHEVYVENEKIILEFDDDSLSGWQEFNIFDKFKKCCKKAFQLYLEGLLKEEIKNESIN
jgi:hypothetical protein